MERLATPPPPLIPTPPHVNSTLGYKSAGVLPPHPQRRERGGGRGRGRPRVGFMIIGTEKVKERGRGRARAKRKRERESACVLPRQASSCETMIYASPRTGGFRNVTFNQSTERGANVKDVPSKAGRLDLFTIAGKQWEYLNKVIFNLNLNILRGIVKAARN